MKEKNILEITYLKAFAIILVFLGHAASGTFLPRPFNYELIVRFIYAFHMPIFFIVSGFLSTKILSMNLKNDYIPYAKSKLIRLGIPFLTISLITNFLIIILLKLSNQQITFHNIIDMLKTIFIYPETGIMGALWFLYTLLAITLIAPFIVKLNKKFILISLLCLNLIITDYQYFLSLTRICFFLIFFFIGLYSRKYYERIRSFLYENSIFTYILSISVLSVYSFIISKNIYIPMIFLNIISFICGLLGCLLLLTISINLSNKKESKTLILIGNYSMDIYIFSWFFQIATMVIITQILHISNFSLFFILSSLIGAFCLPFSMFIIRKIKFFRFVFLGI